MRKLAICTTLLAMVGLVGPTGAWAAAPLVRCDLALDRGVLPSGPAQSAVIKITLDVPLMLGSDQRKCSIISSKATKCPSHFRLEAQFQGQKPC
ncbi:MAG: hypothetical protein IH614_19180 [Desulfuromonadales bacterium]|nr:hypothetical protein [Desulfuromonadales bacterium]